MVQFATSQGLWAAMFTVLLFYILRKQEKRDEQQAAREAEYQKLLLDLTNKLEIVNEISKDVETIKEKIGSSATL